MATVTLYQTMIPAHSLVDDATIEAALSLAVRAHASPAVWGDVWPEAMVWYAAHSLQKTPGVAGVPGASGASEVGPVQSQKDDRLQRVYGAVSSGQQTTLGDIDLATTVYGMAYLRLRGTRSVRAPTFVRM